MTPETRRREIKLLSYNEAELLIKLGVPVERKARGDLDQRWFSVLDRDNPLAILNQCRKYHCCDYRKAPRDAD